MSAISLRTINRLATLLNSPAVRLDVYHKVRRAFKGVSALCAATASEYLIRAGVLDGYHPWTSDLEGALNQKGWVTIGGTGALAGGKLTAGQVPGDQPMPSLATGVALAPPLRPFDLCYTVDSNRNGAPDHVFFFLGWLDHARLIAEVVDNYAPHSHPRNLGAPCWYGGKRLAYGKFSRAQRMPTQPNQ